MKTGWLMLMFLSGSIAFISCTPNGPDTSGFAGAVRMAEEVEETNLMPWIEQLEQARLSDVKVNCDGFKEEDLFPACELTRDASTIFVLNTLHSFGYAPDTVVLDDGTLASYNIVAEWPGISKSEEVLLIASHHDAFYAGADDNASAVAALLEAARVVRSHRFARTIRFVSFDLEEYGSIGSTRYVQAGYANDVTMAIVMDMIGYASDKPGSQDDVLAVKLPDTGDFLLVIGNDDSADLAQQMTALGNSSGLAKLLGLIAPGDGTYFLSSVFMRSDHGLLWYKGIPTLFLTDSANFRNPHYHKPSDTPQTLDAAFLARNTKALTAAIALFAEVQP
jgi:Zn-dependent M28 family amino/carboxypeptidase